LLVPRTRRIAKFAAIGLHLLLLLILGPWGLSHQPGVLVWNLFFIAQAWMLFANRDADEECGPSGSGGLIADKESDTNDPRRGVTESLAYLLAGVAIAFPASESFGYCDHWPAWELYSPRSSRIQIAIHESAVDRLPPEIQRHLSSAGENVAWRQLHIDRWSLDALSVPIYPEDRFQMGVALELARQYELALAIHVTRQSASDRWTGERQEVSYVGRDQLLSTSDRFHFNLKAR
jgi:hypothetical protein